MNLEWHGSFLPNFSRILAASIGQVSHSVVYDGHDEQRYLLWRSPAPRKVLFSKAKTGLWTSIIHFRRPAGNSRLLPFISCSAIWLGELSGLCKTTPGYIARAAREPRLPRTMIREAAMPGLACSGIIETAPKRPCMDASTSASISVR
jgi:hypothetical protein